MNRPQLLKYLRQLGEAGHQGFTWRYELHDDCHLAVVGREAGRADKWTDAIFAMAFFQKMQMNCVGQGALAPV